MPTDATSEISIRVYSDETDLEYEFEYHVIWQHDPDYGADADGRRGESRWFIDDVIFMHSDPPLLAADRDLVERYKDYAIQKAENEGIPE